METMRAIIEIPVELVKVIFRVEKKDPIGPILEAVKNREIDSSLNSVQRLVAMSSSNLELSKDTYFPTLVLRDLWKGKFWTMKERNLDYTEGVVGSVHQIEPIEQLNPERYDGNVKEIAKPFLGWLANASNIGRKEILGHIRLEEISCDSEIFHVKTSLIRREDKSGRKFWVHEHGPFKQLVGEFIEDVEGFEMTQEVQTEQEGNWPYSPEVKALKKLRTYRNDEQKTLETFDQVISELQEDDRPRLNEVKPCVGFRQDMWDSALEVIKSAKKHVYILSSFSNIDHIGDVLHHLSEATPKNSVRLTIAFGEPNRGRSPEDIIATEAYLKKLSSTPGVKVVGGVTLKPSHAKLIVSDSGCAFVTSCNLFSGSFESGVLESGLLVRDNACAASLIAEVIEAGWHSEAQSMELASLLQDLREHTPLRARINNRTIKTMKKLRNKFHKTKRYTHRKKFEHILLDIAEKPAWSLLREQQHRPFMEDCIDRFEHSIALASDGLRSNGLDLATIQRIHQQAHKHRSTVRIWWGRHAPGSKPFDEIDKRGRKEAKDRLEKMRQLSNDVKTWKFLPRNNHEPMETHAKLFIVDDLRLAITSDNTLSFGDTMSERGDAGELGLVLDHPRLSIQTRGSMELWLPKGAVVPGDSTRWWAALGEEVIMNTTKPSQNIPLEQALDSMIGRIESSPYLSNLWSTEIESEFDENQILNKLAKGTSFGVFRIYDSEKSTEFQSKIEALDQQVIALAGKSPWTTQNVETNLSDEYVADVEAFMKKHGEDINEVIDNVLLEALKEYNSKSGKREHFILQGKRTYRFKPPNSLVMKFTKGFVHGYLEKERKKIEDQFRLQHGLDLDLIWPIPKQVKSGFQIKESEEITPALWSRAFVHYMRAPDDYEWASHVIQLMNTQHPRLNLGPGKVSKYITKQCGEYLEIQRRNKPVKNSLYVRRRKR